MIQYLSVRQVIEIHEQIMEKANESGAITDRGLLESAVAQPQMTFDGTDLYPTIVEKAAALGFSMIKNHPFVDGNKRVGLAAALMFLKFNGITLHANKAALTDLVLDVAQGKTDKETIAAFLRENVAK